MMIKFLSFIKVLLRKNKVFSFFLNSKIIYIVLIIIILVQFILVSIIFFENKKNRYLLEQINFRAASLENRINKVDEKVSNLQSYVMRLVAQFYRIQNEEENK